ncbi:hypothetical protein QP445_14365, partial [Micrococcus luteus]|nr:hypothetical protein [Micrococcus luteus]
EMVDKNIADALSTTDEAEKTRLYKEAQEQIWNDAPWAFLVTGKLLYAHSTKISGFNVMPDGSFEYRDLDKAE